MKRSLNLMTLLLLFAVNSTALFAQQSDYQIKKDWNFLF